MEIKTSKARNHVSACNVDSTATVGVEEASALCQSIVAASFLNNSAVGWMHTGEVALSYQLLSVAVGDMQNKGNGPIGGSLDSLPSWEENSNSHIGHPPIACCSQRMVFMSGSDSQTVTMQPPYLSCNLPKYHNDDQSFVMFERALLVETTLALRKRSFDLVAAAMFYNLALLYHRDGVKYGKFAYLKKADELYISALDAITTSIRNQVCSEPDASLIMLAIWNNRGHIGSWHIVDFSEARQFIHRMKTILRRSTPGVTILPCDHRVFFLNALVCDNGMLKGSSPAA